jgi:hypothetical protein
LIEPANQQSATGNRPKLVAGLGFSVFETCGAVAVPKTIDYVTSGSFTYDSEKHWQRKQEEAEEIFIE